MLDALMVRRLPVLQSGPAESAPLAPAKAAAIAAAFALLVWAVLLWGVRQFGAPGVGAAFVFASGSSVVIFGGRVPLAGRRRFYASSTAFFSISAWIVASLGGTLDNPWIAVLALGALLGLGGLGTALGILVLFWRQRGSRSR